MSTSDDGSTGSRLTGTVLEGRYRVGAVIARGGMSTVYRGIDLRLDRPVAIKVMQPSFASDPTFLTRFEREARLAAGLAHRGVVAVYDQGRDDEVVFLVMELVDGGTLRDLIRQSGALSVSVTMSILEPLLSALGAAHAGGLVHRDVKPENVLISSKGEVKVADFGLVRAISSQTMATGNVILGTVAYLSPEQVATGAADARSDVYSAGVVAFEMLTGHPPYGGDNAISVAYQHVHSDIPPVTDQAPGVPVELDDLILAATRRDPMARPRDASAFLSAVVSMRARLGLARAAVPVPRAPSAPAGPLPQRSAASQSHTTARPAGPGGTRVAGARAGGAQVGGAQVGGTRAGAGRAGAGRPATLDLAVGARGSEAVEAPFASPVRSPRPKSRLRRWLILMLVVLLLGVAAAAGGWWLGSGRWAYIPSAVGEPQPAAEGLVRDAGLVPQITTAPNDVVPMGTVADTEPISGSRLLRGSDVRLVVSSGRPVVPAIVAGTASEEASKLVSAADLTPAFDNSADRYDKSVPSGAVLATEPPGNTTVAVSAQVVIIRSRGPRPITVPSVTGKSPEDARNKLLVAGFTVAAAKRVFSADFDDGSVLGTDPAVGREVSEGSPVALVLASSLTVPAIRGESVERATADLEQAGFTVTAATPAFDADVDGGSAIGTTPAPGTRVDPADPAILLAISNDVVVPDLGRDNVGQARQQLAELGLVTDVSAMFGSAGAAVIDQSPGSGSRVQPGSTVTLTAFP